MPLTSILGTDVAGVQTARDADVGGAFDDRAAVWKNGQQVGRNFKPEREFVGTNRAEGRKAGRQIA